MSSFATGAFAGLAVFLVIPEAWSESGYWLCFGWLMTALVDRFLYPLCRHCGGAGPWPLFTALAIHSALDGALFACARPGSVAAWGILLHRLPETAAVWMLLAGGKQRGWQMLALQGVALAGYAGAQLFNAALLSPAYGLAAGALLFFGVHRFHQHWEEADLHWMPLGAGLLVTASLRLWH